MSTTNTENLTLYANAKLYNGSRYVFYQTNRDYEQWLRQNSSSVISKTVYFKSLTEDMELNSSVKDILKYTYGKLTNDGKDYYIFIDKIVTDQHGKSYISFSVDWWATEWANVHPTKAHLIRSSTKPGYMAQPFAPMKTTYDSVPFSSDRSNKGCYMFTYIPSNQAENSYISIGIMDITDKSTALVQSGYWYQKLRIPGADVKDCFVVPLVSTDDFVQGDNYVNCIFINELPEHGVDLAAKISDAFAHEYPNTYLSNSLHPYIPTWSWEEQGDPPSNYGTAVYDVRNNHYYRVYYKEEYIPTDVPPYYIIRVKLVAFDETIDFSQFNYRKTYTYEEQTEDERWVLLPFIMSNNDETIEAYNFTISGLNITSTEKITMGINDWNSDLIWECPYGVTVNSFNVRLLIGISHIMLEFLANGQTKNGSKLTNVGFSYDCRHPGLFVDSYQDYILKNRDYDIAMRQIQSEKQEWAAISSTFENIGFGMAFGQKTGAAAAGIGGIVESLATFVINQEFDPRIQEQYNFRYARMTDQISLVGDSITNVYNERNNGLLQVYTLSMDIASQTRMDNDISINGYVCDEYVSNLETLFGVGNIIKADSVVVEGATCLESKHQTVYRLQNGVEFI